MWNQVLGLTCLPASYKLDDGISARETTETVSPEQTSAILGVWKWFLADAVDGGKPLQYDDFPHGRALSSAG
jgi:hypothetical protein